MAKELIKGGLVAMEAVTEFFAEAGEQIKDLIAEAKSELAKSEDSPESRKDEASQNRGVNTDERKAG